MPNYSITWPNSININCIKTTHLVEQSVFIVRQNLISYWMYREKIVTSRRFWHIV